jgi:hypothetical protein
MADLLVLMAAYALATFAAPVKNGFFRRFLHKKLSRPVNSRLELVYTAASIGS